MFILPAGNVGLRSEVKCRKPPHYGRFDNLPLCGAVRSAGNPCGEHGIADVTDAITVLYQLDQLACAVDHAPMDRYRLLAEVCTPGIEPRITWTEPAIRGRWWSGYVSLRSLRLAANLGPIRQVDFGWSTTRPFHWLPIRIVGDGRRPLVPLGHHLQYRRSQSECHRPGNLIRW